MSTGGPSPKEGLQWGENIIKKRNEDVNDIERWDKGGEGRT